MADGASLALTPFADVADFTNGYAFGPADWGKSGLPIIRIQQLLDPVAEADSCEAAVGDRYLINTGDLVMSWSGTIAVVRWDRGPAWLNQHLFRVDPKPGVDDSFLKHLLDSSLVGLEAAAHGTTMKHIKRGDLLRHEVLLPPEEEQRRIAKILDTIDETIHATERIIAKLSALMNGVTTDQFRLADDGCRVSLAEVADISGGLALSAERAVPDAVELPYLRVANVQDGYIDTSTMRKVRVSRADVERYAVRRGDVLMNEGGDFDKLGRGAVWDGRIDPCLHQNHVFRVRCVPDLLVPEFLALFCRSDEAKSYFVNNSKQTTNLASINKSQIGALPTLVPDLSQQRQAVSVVAATQSRIAAEAREVSGLRALRAGLASDLLSGRVRTVTL